MSMSETAPHGRCFGCWWGSPHTSGGDAVFVDSRTGRRFCHEHIMILASWEMDGCPEVDFAAYSEWIGKENVRESTP